MSMCVSTTGYRVCGQDSTGRLIAGCEHEHIVSNPFCDDDAQFWRQEISQRSVYCTDCENGRRPHECLLWEIAWQPLTVTAGRPGSPSPEAK
jgi:hypothetical protein